MTPLRRETAILLAATGMAVCACSGPGSVPAPSETYLSASGALRIDVRFSPNPPTRGTVAAELAIQRAADGSPVDGLTLVVVPWMPAMNHGAGAQPNVVAEGGGRYEVSNLDLYMAGRWELRTAITGSEPDSGVLVDNVSPAFDIP